MKIAKSLAAITAFTAIAAPAVAHEGDHSATVVANIIHWLSNPTHSLFAVIGGVIVAGLIVKLSRRKA